LFAIDEVRCLITGRPFFILWPLSLWSVHLENSYVGITPTIRESGSSVRGRSRISKVGNKKLRNLVFLAAFSAYKYNRACKALFDRLVVKGKRAKLALIAVANKLLKQAFAIAKSGLPYDENYVLK